MILKLVRGVPVMLLVAGFALLGPTPRAHAELTLTITEDAFTPIAIVDNDANDTNPVVGAIDVNVPAVNALLTQFTLVTLGTLSNSPGTTTFPQLFTLSETGSLFRTPGTTGSESITITSSNTGYVSLTGATGPRSGSSTAIFTNGGTGDTQTSTVYNDPSNTLNGLVNPLGGPGSTLDFAATGTPLTGSTQAFAGNVTGGTIAESTFSMTTTTAITLGPPGSSVLMPHQVQFSTSQTKLAAAAVPEPATMALVVTGLPVLGLGAWLRRRGKQA